MVRLFPSQSRIAHLPRGRTSRQLRRKSGIALLLLGEGPVKREFICELLLAPAPIQ
jgi:hypothetical protein